MGSGLKCIEEVHQGPVKKRCVLKRENRLLVRVRYPKSLMLSLNIRRRWLDLLNSSNNTGDKGGVLGLEVHIG